MSDLGNYYAWRNPQNQDSIADPGQRESAGISPPNPRPQPVPQAARYSAPPPPLPGRQDISSYVLKRLESKKSDFVRAASPNDLVEMMHLHNYQEEQVSG